jgi:hypothetical protein
MDWFAAIGGRAVKVAIGPHSSATPSATLRKTRADVVIKGEPDQAIADLACKPWGSIDGVCWKDSEGEHISASLAVTEMKSLKALDFHN